MFNAAINHETESLFLSNISLCSRFCKGLESGRWCVLAVFDNTEGQDPDHKVDSSTKE